MKGLKNTQQTLIERRYYPFGKYIINHYQLRENNILLVKNPNTLSPIYLKRTSISNEFRNLLIDLLDTQKINIELQEQVDNKEQEILEKLLQKANLTNQLDFKKRTPNIETYIKRFKLIQGTLAAGNYNDKIIDEAKEIIKILSSPLINKISLKDAEMLLDCLN